MPSPFWSVVMVWSMYGLEGTHTLHAFQSLNCNGNASRTRRERTCHAFCRCKLLGHLYGPHFSYAIQLELTLQSSQKNKGFIHGPDHHRHANGRSFTRR
ncbi:MAG: hypothetical protein J3R72DRAFT_82923 [Linnemannia gamsii]|nr:MAG: hypothetical protein J3R72DRAFT_82923 [Linnemannia gamsii]